MEYIIYEIINYGNCQDINDFIYTVGILQGLAQQNTNVVNYLENIKNNYTQYITKIITKRNQHVFVPPLNILDIYDESTLLMLFGIIVENIVIYKNKPLTAYSLLKSIENVVDEDNLIISTVDEDDYIACYICLLNIVYKHGGGKNIDDILVSPSTVADRYIHNAVYITDIHSMPAVLLNIKNMFTIIPTSVANNTNEKAYVIKKCLLDKYIPTMFLTQLNTDEWFCIKLTTNENNTTCFQIDGLNDVVYTAKSDWTKTTQTVLLHDNMKVLQNLYLFEENIKHVKQLVDIKHNFDQPWYCENIDKRFSFLDINNSIIKQVSYIEMKLSDVLVPLRTAGTRITQEGTLYPYVSSINTNNGISCYVDKHDVSASDDNPVISIGMTHTGRGYAFVHTYDFAHSPNTVLFKMKTTDINPYNVAFSITEYMVNIADRLPKDISMNLVLCQYIKIIVPEF